MIELAQRIRGFKTLESVEEELHVTRARAIYLMYRLRKAGFVITRRGAGGTRVYRISPRYALGGTSYTEVLNENTPIKMNSLQVHEIYGRKPSIEETLVVMICKKEIRYLISSLALFRKIRNWSELYRLAKEKGILRQVGALYDLARQLLPKIRKMPKRFLNRALPPKNARYQYIIDAFSSAHFQKIEEKWKVYIPLNADDVREYRGVIIS